ncbi:MAG: GH25 family lysozyme [Actinomycetota bacterium]
MIAAAVAAAAFILLFQRGYVRFQYPSREDFPVSGVDVSHHQDEIDWPAFVQESEIDFAFIKATEGTDLMDRRFQENWRDAEGRVARSAYHFFTFCTSGDDQARNFLSTAPDSGELPRAIDLEFGGNCTSWKSLAEVRSELKELVSAVEQKDGRAPILYVTKQSYNRIVRGHFEGVPIWIREVVFRPSAEEYPDLMFWQYAGNGRLEGVDTLVDLNVFVGTTQSFGDLVRRVESIE